MVRELNHEIPPFAVFILGRRKRARGGGVVAYILFLIPDPGAFSAPRSGAAGGDCKLAA